MIKNILVSFGLLFSMAVFAQEGTSSPYSYYGLGDVRFKGTAENRAMGTLSIAADSIHMNLQNPAGYSFLKLTNFAVGGTQNYNNLHSNSGSADAQRTTLDYLALAFPVGKMGFGFGIIPYSSVGYRIQSTGEGLPSRQYSGKGGLNRVFLGASYKITDYLSFGVEGNYNFGDVETRNVIQNSGVQYGTREINNSNLTGFNANFGLMFDKKIGKKYHFAASATYSPEGTITSENERNLATVLLFANGNISTVEERNLTVDDTEIKMPSKFSFGVGMGEQGKWFAGAEAVFQESSSFGNRFNDIQNVAYENSQKYVLGGYFIPQYNSYDSYLKRVTYRAGFRYETTGLVISDVSIKDYAGSVGVGLPLGGMASNLNIGFEYGQRGTIKNNLVRETYANIIIGLSLNDKWFQKRRYD